MKNIDQMSTVADGIVDPAAIGCDAFPALAWFVPANA